MSGVFEYNGGICLAMKGKECVGIACDKRYGMRFATVTTDCPKIFEFGPKLFIGMCGLSTDINTVHERLKFRTGLYELNEHRPVKPSVVARMLSNFLYEHRFGPYFVNPVVAGLNGDEPHVYQMDIIGCLDEKPDFAIGGGTAEEQCVGLAEQFWKPLMNPDELFEAISQTILNGFDRDALSGWGADVYIIEKDKVTHRQLKARLD
ncbi:hypothetical protein ACOME3_008484 [Neoechinorhynchus agilis]